MIIIVSVFFNIKKSNLFVEKTCCILDLAKQTDEALSLENDCSDEHVSHVSL